MDRRRSLLAASMQSGGGGGEETRLYTMRSGRAWHDYSDTAKAAYTKYWNAPYLSNTNIDPAWLESNPLYIDDIKVTSMWVPFDGCTSVYFWLEDDFKYYESQVSSDYFFGDAFLTSNGINIFYEN